MSVDPSTRTRVLDHLGQAEFALKVVANFDCLRGRPAHGAVRAALAQVTRAKDFVREQFAVAMAGRAHEPVSVGAAEKHRIIQRRMGGLAP